MRFWVVLAFLLVAGAARADDAGTDWADFSRNASALDDVSPADCETACKALQSLARAAEHICAVAPEHCQEARSRLAAAREKVRAACPDSARRVFLGSSLREYQIISVTAMEGL